MKKAIIILLTALSPIIIGIIISKIINERESIVIWTIILAISTILLGLIAAFQDVIRNIFYKPILKCELDLSVPHCHLLNEVNTYFIRFKIHNIGNINAKNVEVFLKYVKDDKGKILKLSPGNLLWSSYILENNHSPRMYWDSISPGTYQYCNLGDIKSPLSDMTEFRGDLTYEQRLSYKFNFSLYWKSIDKSFSIKPGKYTFEIVVGCSNAKAINKLYEIEFTGNWTNEENEMFKKEINVLKEKNL
jgi:hypothetical protein